MTYIKKLTMSGFKSFGDRTVSIKFAKGFTTIIGPNGNGKSNVVDAICFALGRLSKKTMRAKSLTDLIFAGTNKLKPANRAEVTITFDNKGKEFPTDSEDFSITRWVKAKGTSGYKIEGKGATREQVLNVLAQANIDPDGENQFVLQGRIVELTHMNTNQRREFIEGLIGLEKYDEMKAETMKELEKADKDLGEFEAIFREVTTQLKKVEKEKNDALRWKELDNKINLFNAQLIALRINNLRTEEGQIETDTEETHQIIEELESKVARQKEMIDAEATLLKGIEEDLAARDGEKQKIDEILTQSKTELSAKETELKNANENLQKLEERKAKLEEMQEQLEAGQTYDDLVNATTEQINQITQEADGVSTVIDETVAEQKQKETQINEINKEKAEINEQISSVRQNISKATTEIDILQKSIGKNEKKLEKMEKELKKLKKDEESIEEAIASTENESTQISSSIEELKGKIEEQKTQQKELDIEIERLEGERDEVNKKLSGVQSSISSTTAEINLNETRITELSTKQENLQAEYDRLTKGKQVDDTIKELKSRESELTTSLADLKEQLRKANEDQQSGQTKKEGMEGKRHALEAEVADVEKRLSGLKVELKTAQSDLKDAETEKADSEAGKATLDKELEDLSKQLEKLQKQSETIQGKLDTLSTNRKEIQDKISEKEGEQNQSSGELSGVVENLSELIHKIESSASEIKASMQNASVEAISQSAESFKQFVMDITDMMQTFEELANEPDTSIIKENMGPAIENFKNFIENADSTIEQLTSSVKEANDKAVQESATNFDSFIQDFMNSFDNIHVALQSVALSDTAESYKSLDGINAEIQKQSNEMAEINNESTKITTQIEQKQNESKRLEAELSDLNKRIDDNTARSEKGQAEFDEKTAQVEQIQSEIAEITSELDNTKKSSEDFWTQLKDVQTQIDAQTEELAQIQKDLGDLKTVQRFLDDIQAAEDEKTKLRDDNTAKQQSIIDLNTAIETVQKEMDAAVENINNVKTQRAGCDETRTQLQTQIDEQNEKLKEVTDRLRSLENVQKLIADIEALRTENTESTSKIEENNQVTEGYNTEIQGFEGQIGEKDSVIEGVQAERAELEAKETDLRKQLQNLSDQKGASEKTLAREQQMKDRALEIEGLANEITQMHTNIQEFETLIQQTNEAIAKTEGERAEKVQTITDLQAQKDSSWEKQKKLRDELSDLTAELSKQQAQMNNLESRKLVVEEKISQLLEQSKDYGALPPVTDDLSESGLSENIAKSTTEKKSLEPVNLKSIEEYDTVKERWDEIDMRRQTLQRERKAIMDSIERIELEKTRTFMKAYHEINRVFSEVFQKLSPGGSAKMLLENPAHPFEGGIAIEARPRGKKISSLQILSGGEKTLVALSFIFAVQNFYPAPFYIMDEIDAALDGPNVYRVAQVIKEYADQSQFIVISHREEEIVESDRIYGVAMQDGITDMFVVNLEEEKAREDFNTPDEKIVSENRDEAQTDTADELVDEEDSGDVNTPEPEQPKPEDEK